MGDRDRVLAWVDGQQEVMLERVARWAGINSGTYHAAGITRMAAALAADFGVLGADHTSTVLPDHVTIGALGESSARELGPLLKWERRRPGKPSVLLNIHYDTVYGETDPFQSVARAADDKLVGPGVTDAKGGIAVLLTAVEAFERGEFADELGWQIILNSDEEIGSPGSAPFLAEAAKHQDLALLFEPALPDGSLVDRRKGSGNFTVVVRGRAAHAGRDFAAGRSALLAAAELSTALHQLNDVLPGNTLNVGSLHSGEASNVVPDLAVLRVNVRATEPTDQQGVTEAVRAAVARISAKDGITVEIHGGFSSPPKVLDGRTKLLQSVISAAGADLGIPISYKPSGGASDGNRLAAAGLPNIDALGVRGGNIHSPSEYLVISSLSERAKLATNVLLKLAAGDVPDGLFRR